MSQPLCACGCGQPVTIRRNRPNTYIRGHWARTPEAAWCVVQFEPPNPSGLCQCGCGEPTDIARNSVSKSGQVEGQPLRYRRGHHRTPSLPERFWSKVDRREPHECWDWKAFRYPTVPYGQFRVSRDPTASGEVAHRVAWRLTHGPIPDGRIVCHHCDNPPCCNPAHLFLGTAADNMADKMAKGRHRSPRGEAVGTAVLTTEAVRDIRARVAKGEMQKTLAAEYGVTTGAISLVVRRINWAHVD